MKSWRLQWQRAWVPMGLDYVVRHLESGREFHTLSFSLDLGDTDKQETVREHSLQSLYSQLVHVPFGVPQTPTSSSIHTGSIKELSGSLSYSLNPYSTTTLVML